MFTYYAAAQGCRPILNSVFKLSFILADFIMLGSVFHNILPLNFCEFNPHLTVFVLGSWTRSFILRL